MKLLKTVIPVLLLTTGVGCTTFSRSATDAPRFIGGERVVYFAAGVEVPAVPASVNTNGWYSLPVADLKAMMEL